MPLLKRKPVVLLPQPNVDNLEPEAPVFYLKQTKEIFLDYESYSNRITYLQSKIFQCEFSGKTNLDYFTALESERAESRVVRERFPDELKGKVLATVQFQIMGRLDALVDLVFERYKDRFFPGEKVFVDLAGDKYFARISKVFPPANIRGLGRTEHRRTTREAAKKAALQSLATTNEEGASPLSSLSPSPPPEGDEGDEVELDDFSPYVHRLGVDLNVSVQDAKKDDDPEEYLYTVQLMDEEHKFEGSFMEVKAAFLSRDRLSFSKSILKRYIRECVQRDSLIASPWTVKPSIAIAYNIPMAQSEATEEKNKKIREGKLAKRKKVNHEDGSEVNPPKKRKTAEVPVVAGGVGGRAAAAVAAAATAAGPIAGPSNSNSGTVAVKNVPPPKAARSIKYPIEDLELDPMTIHDGRILRRVNSEIPPLPPKPVPSRDLLVPKENFDQFIMIWNMLNVFSKPISISPFSLDDFAGALSHAILEPRCTLIAEMHACLTNLIGTDTSRVLGSTSAPALPSAGAGPSTEPSTPTAEEDGQESDVEEGEEGDEHGEEEFDMLLRKGIQYAKRWDRQAKLKMADGREGWERHLVGALCQRGGPLSMPNLPRILRHLFEGADFTSVRRSKAGGTSSVDDSAPVPMEIDRGVPPSSQLTDLDELASNKAGTPAIDTSNTEAAYLTLPLGDKLDILSYLCTLALGSKLVRNYIEESESHLTEFRKERAEVNKDRKKLTEQKAVLDGKPLKAEPGSLTANGQEAPSNGNGTPTGSVRAASVDPDQTNNSIALGTGVGMSRAGGSSTTGDVDEEDEEDQLADDDELDHALDSELDDVPSIKGDDYEEEEEEDEDDENGTSENGGNVSGAISARRSALSEQKAERIAAEAARSIELAKARLEAKAKNASKRLVDRERFEVEDGLRKNLVKDDWVEREFRRYLGVPRCRPLGKDRFFNRYWWFDGVGGMNLLAPNGHTPLYGTGRLFVQGPSAEDWEMASRMRKDEDLMERRKKEEVEEEAILQQDEWGFYEEEEELDALQSWLNGKGARELALKNSLAKWRGYILAGSRKRATDMANPYRSAESRRTTRGRADAPQLGGYLNYQNKEKRH